MPTLDLVALDRRRSMDVREAWSPEDAKLPGSDLELSETVYVDLRATLTATDQVLVEGELTTTLGQACRRCLEPVSLPSSLSVALLFVPESDVDSDDGEVRAFDPARAELDLSEALREEMVLSVPRYAECREECRGLCPGCGVNRNTNECDCSVEEPDPRWEALRALSD